MRQFGLAAASVLALSACDPEVPDSAAGAGVNDYATYQRSDAAIRAERNAQLASSRPSGSPEATGAPTASGAPTLSAGDLAAAGIGTAAPPSTAATPLPTSAPLTATAAGAAYLGGNTAAPVDVPVRPNDTGPDIVAYALSATQPVGQTLYTRTLPNRAKAERNCAGYGSDDMAQFAFMEAGGPQKDRFGIDPDGDGYACNWDPGRYRRAVGG
ncbi:hypothetical protein R3X27_05640 [Tropicimonas sp. TH_r6]|uniref:hypothetical protein n=1 Tax=Tropicimonas sp. TH_r6 TaxID=3082085 RepID=UPI0029547AAD|nr:hypothetical protein [Tropicimonas sp. TH_r6]MDV7142157.1 hypothetical protein [Tropicimonas sp. TH_r6]